MKTQIKLSLEAPGKRRWWYQEARGDIRKFFLNPEGATRQLKIASDRLRDTAADEDNPQRKKNLLASARAIEAFSPIADDVRIREVVASPGKRDDSQIQRGSVRIVVAPDLVFLEKGTEQIVGALKLHASREFKLNREALLNAASILYTYLEEHGECPQRDYCTVVDVFTPSFESTPRGLVRRMQAVEASCEEIEHWWYSMYETVKADVEGRHSA